MYSALDNAYYDTVEQIGLWFGLFIAFSAILIFVGTVNRVLKKQYTFRYPYFQHKFDITGKRKTDMGELVKSFIADESNWNEICEHHRIVEEWKKKPIRICRIHREGETAKQDFLRSQNGNRRRA